VRQNNPAWVITGNSSDRTGNEIKPDNGKSTPIHADNYNILRFPLKFICVDPERPKVDAYFSFESAGRVSIVASK
jgi:hypothetical protein